MTNPLCGPHGASAIYGPQKGASPADVQELDAALAHYAAVIERDLGKRVVDVPGAGAAGGIGAGLIAFLGAELRPGAQLVAEVVGLEKRIAAADLVVTGEGRLDAQTAYGKTVATVARLAQKQGRPVVALAGNVDDARAACSTLGLEAALAIVPSAIGTARGRGHGEGVGAAGRRRREPGPPAEAGACLAGLRGRWIPRPGSGRLHSRPDCLRTGPPLAPTRASGPGARTGRGQAGRRPP